MLVRGVEMVLHDNEMLSNHIRRENDFFEAEILDYIALHFPVHRTILDIGANIGNHAVFFANFLKYESIICFEPVIENYVLLAENLKPYDNIGICNSAVGNYTGLATMQRDFANMGAGEIREQGDIQVPIIALDRVRFQNVTLMKIDVERHEPQVIDGAYETIYQCRPLILIEDVDNEYAKLLPEYSIIQAWPDHRTYLYGWSK